MRIALVSEHSSPMAAPGGPDVGGQNVYVAALATTLARQGHDVVVHTRRSSRDLPRDVRLAPRVRVHHVPAGPPEHVPKDELLRHMPAFAEHLRRQWRQTRPDIVHAHFWMSGIASLDAAASAGVPVVHTYHALGLVKRRHQGALDTSPPERIAYERYIGHGCARIIATCGDEALELMRMGIDRAHIAVIPCGVDIARFSPDAPDSPDEPSAGEIAPTPTARLRVLSLGRLVQRKGVDIVISSLREVPDAELLIAGGPGAGELARDPEADRLRAVAEDAGVADRVRFLGGVPRERVPSLLRGCDVVACTPWYEPFGMVPLEAMACGRPVVAAAVGGLTDTVLNGVTGLLVPPRSPAAVADALRRLAASPDLRRRLGDAGLARVRSRYTWQRVAAEALAVYEAVCRRSPRAAHFSDRGAPTR